MRRWVCIVALLAGFTSEDYVRSARLRQPVAVERLIGGDPRAGRAGVGRAFARTGAWWSLPRG